MRGGRRFVAITVSLGLAALVPLGTGAGAAGARAKPPAKVTVNDFYFAPTAVTIKKGGSVKWVWSSTNAYPHDVHLKKGPANLKRKGSYSTKTSAVSEAQFQKKFETPGSYKYVCTIHPSEMRMTVTVKR
ncbi:MAG TPA: plastocyanin/azurin family copper-binding protein [Solirubrobacterales bacterium]|nr:plastocyanin/azurin family copper-binding protein [Solirubrobacterales bacterium]